MSPSPTPLRDEKAEAWLAKRGVKFVGPRWLPLDKIKRVESRQNQARADALVSEVVDRYTTNVRAGDSFPSIVTYKNGTGYRIIDGNHRDEAHVRGGRTEIGIYVVDETTSSDLIELLTVEANTRHGQPTDTAWRITQALHLIATGWDVDTVVDATGVTKSQITMAKRAAKADERARRLGIYGWDDMSQTARGTLATLTTDPVFRAAADVVLDSGMATDDLKDFIRKVKGANSEAEALKVIAETREARKGMKATKGKRQPLADPRNRVLSALGAVAALTPEDLPRLFHTDWERKNVAGRCGDAAMVLMEMEEVLRRALAQ